MLGLRLPGESVLFFLLRLWIMLVTSLKPMGRSASGILAWSDDPTLEPWLQAWSKACTGLECNGISVGLREDHPHPDPLGDPLDRRRCHQRLRPSFWKVRGADLDVAILLAGAFIPYQVS